MRKGLYPKMAADNIRKNSKVYLPFLISCIGAVMMTYIVRALSLNSGISEIPGGRNLQGILSMGYAVVSIFSAIFLFYTNSFLMKRRKKEFGVYSILGMEKKQIDLEKGAEKTQVETFGTILGSKLKSTDIQVTIFETKASAGDKFRALRGGVLFLGINLGILLLMATVLIIYYKQISEAYDDKDRYSIMRKVGLSRSEIKKTIRSQILSVFFLPLVVTGIHVAFTYPLMEKLMVLILLNDVKLFLIFTVAAYALFVLIYAVIYTVTARTYYRIVSA